MMKCWRDRRPIWDAHGNRKQMRQPKRLGAWTLWSINAGILASVEQSACEPDAVTATTSADFHYDTVCFESVHYIQRAHRHHGSIPVDQHLAVSAGSPRSSGGPVTTTSLAIEVAKRSAGEHRGGVAHVKTPITLCSRMISSAS